MAYPVSPVQGDQVGANLVPRPAFPDANKGAWLAGTVESRDIGGGVMRNRLGAFTVTRITLPGVPVAAASFRITVLAAVTNSAAIIGVRPVGASRTPTAVGFTTTGYETRTITSPILSTDTGSEVELYVWAPASGNVGIVSVRVDYADSPVSGYFDGDTADNDDHVFAWAGTAFASASTAAAGSSYPVPGGGDPDPGDPDPGDPGDPEPGEGSDAAKRVANLLGRPDDAVLVALAEEPVAVITAMVRAYTRGNGFASGQPNVELAAVVTTAAARLVANPEQLASDVGNVSMRGGFQGWSLAETVVLNRYRVRAR